MVKGKNLRKKKTWAETLKWATIFVALISGFTGGVLLFVYLMSGEIYDYEDSAKRYDLPEVDVIVCLAGGRGRVRMAGELWEQYRRFKKEPPKLYFSGTGPQMNWQTLKKQMDPSIQNLIPESSVVIEAWSANTSENAWWLAKYARENRWRKFLLLTSTYHMKRSKFIFETVLKHPESRLLSVKIETLSTHQEPFTGRQWNSNINSIYVTMIEYFKWIYYRVFWVPTAPLVFRV